MPPIRHKAGPRRGPKAISDTLREALSHLESLADTRPDDDPKRDEYIRRHWRHGLKGAGVSQSPDLPIHACSVEREHREAVRLFLETWVNTRIRDAIDALDGKKLDYDSYVGKD